MAEEVINKFEWPKTKENMLMGLCPIDCNSINPDEWIFGDAKKLHEQEYYKEAEKVQEILEDKLIKWQKTHEEKNFKLSYTYDTIIITTENIIEWTKELHEELCNEFHVILFEHSKTDTFQHNHYQLECNYIYISWIDTEGIPELERTKKNFTLNWSEILF